MIYKLRNCTRCGVDFTPNGSRQERCEPCVGPHNREFASAYRQTHKAERKANIDQWRDKNKESQREIRAAFYKENRDDILTLRREHRKSNPEFYTVKAHYAMIFTNNDPRLHNYKQMPFFDGWNPKKGGSFKAGGDWIIDNIGRKPKESGWSLHIVNHELGFVPGNLEWASKRKQAAEQMFKIIARQKNRIRELEEALEKATPYLSQAA